MLLQALSRYYEILISDPQSGIAPPGYGVANVSFALVLSKQGELLDLFSLFQKAETSNKEFPLRMLVPEPKKRSGKTPPPNFLCDNSAYVLGLTSKGENDPDFALRRFEAFRDCNCEILAQADCDEARAVRAFLNSYHPSRANQIAVIESRREDLLASTANLVFKLEGAPGYVHEAPDIRRAWELARASGEAKIGQCLVTGQRAPIARLHPSLKAVRGANSSGASLVSFNEQAYESYNRRKAQGLNSPVSEQAAFAYTTALNYLLSRDNPNRQFIIGDTTVVYWAESPDPRYAQRFAGLFEVEEVDEDLAPEEAPRGKRDVPAEQRLREAADKVQRGSPISPERLLEDLNPDTRFYVLGLAPNAARVSVRFFHVDAFKKIIEKILAHYEDLQIEKEFFQQPTFISPYRIISETVSKKSSDPKPAPLLGGALMRSILSGAPYPAALFQALITRIRADQDDKQKRISKINYTRAAVIKAYLLRKYRNQKQHPIQEVLCMSLNEQSDHPAYLLGRLFAVLERAQQKAIGDTNASIKDRYFTSACASPSTVFPTLLRLSQHHLSKANWKYGDRLIGQIMERLDVVTNPIPARLSLDGQGVFVMGYYHQHNAFYLPRAAGSQNEEIETANRTEGE